MHGSHHLNDEYSISAGRLDPQTKPVDCYNFARSKIEAQSSPKSMSIAWSRFIKNFLSVASILLLTLYLALNYFETSQKFDRSQGFYPRAASSISLVKRNHIPRLEGPDKLETLMIILNDPKSLNEILDSDSNTIVITKDNNSKTVFDPERVIIDAKSSSIFESILFGLCEAKTSAGRYPEMMTIIGPSQAETCVMKRFQWSLKIPKQSLKYIVIEGSDTGSAALECNPNRNDLFDCTNQGRKEVRLEYSQKCPELEPFLLACSSRAAFKAALEYKPPWWEHNKDFNK